MKVFGADANIQPMPNPKPLPVQRGRDSEGATVIVHNMRVFPHELLKR